jgi:hypothetical protein
MTHARVDALLREAPTVLSRKQFRQTNQDAPAEISLDSIEQLKIQEQEDRT